MTFHRFARFAVLGALAASLVSLHGAVAVAHEQHGAAAVSSHAANGYRRTVETYSLPPVALVDMEGAKVALSAAMGTDEPVILNFIYTTCTTVCPILSATFTEVHEMLTAERRTARLISISIDPEYDTPVTLKDYAARYGAGPDWSLYTGSLADIVAVQKAFDAYRGSKANHVPLTFMRASRSAPWVRLDGFAGAADIVNEFRRLPSR